MSKKLIAITLLALSFVLVNCKDNSEPEPEKTLNKSLITNKKWVTTAGPYGFYLRSDGYVSAGEGTLEQGTWDWLNNSDSLEIYYDGIPSQVWQIKYCTGTEMSARNGTGSQAGPYWIFTVEK